jgi:hypothetical protein
MNVFSGLNPHAMISFVFSNASLRSHELRVRMSDMKTIQW